MSSARASICAGGPRDYAANCGNRFGVVGLAAAAVLLAIPLPSYSQTELVIVDVKAVARRYRASKLIGTNVMNDKNEKIAETSTRSSLGATVPYLHCFRWGLPRDWRSIGRRAVPVSEKAARVRAQ